MFKRAKGNHRSSTQIHTQALTFEKPRRAVSNFFFLGGANYRAPWRDFTGAMAPLKSEGLHTT
jgi:hypothetical protein